MAGAREQLSAEMRAVRLVAPGLGGLAFDTIRRPQPDDGEALVEVRAAAITRDELDWPVDRLPAIPSYEFSGVVAAVGGGVEGLSERDEVYALSGFDRDGAAAEFISVPAKVLALRPRSIDHVRSAALPLAALSAWQGLFDHGRLEAGQRVLVSGATGGVGHLAVQLAANRGATVIGITSADKADIAKELGCHEVIDSKSAFTEEVHPVDLVFDTVGGELLMRSSDVLRAGGRLISIAEDPPTMPPRSGIDALYFVVEPSRDQLTQIAEFVDGGALKTLIDSVFPLAEAAEAFARSMQRDTRGKVVLRVRDA